MPKAGTFVRYFESCEGKKDEEICEGDLALGVWTGRKGGDGREKASCIRKGEMFFPP